MKKDKTNKIRNVSKEQWLSQALDTLEVGGVEAIKIERLAKALGTSKSGFYWHFNNRQDLLEHLLNYWVREYTGVVTNNPDITKLEPEMRLLAIMRAIRDQKLAKFDLAMSFWAKIDDNVRKVVDNVVKMRLDYLRTLFAELGFTEDELEMRVRLFLCYHTWEDAMFPDLSNQKYSILQNTRHRFFIRK
jgi:AcrR family transcriptional regulator